MPYFVITDDDGNVLWSKEISNDSLADASGYLRQKLPIIEKLKRYKDMISSAQEILEHCGVARFVRRTNTIAPPRKARGNQNRTNRTRTR